MSKLVFCDAFDFSRLPQRGFLFCKEFLVHVWIISKEDFAFSCLSILSFFLFLIKPFCRWFNRYLLLLQKQKAQAGPECITGQQTIGVDRERACTEETDSGRLERIQVGRGDVRSSHQSFWGAVLCCVDNPQLLFMLCYQSRIDKSNIAFLDDKKSVTSLS